MRIRSAFRHLGICLSFLPIFLSCGQTDTFPREAIDLGGGWQFQLDPENRGVAESWFSRALSDSIRLPGTLDENRKGVLNRDTTDMHLSRVYTYTGPAWFRKEIMIPESWQGKHVELIMERTKVTRVWLDSQEMGEDNTLFSEQVFDLTEKITPGKHTLTICVNNDPALVPVAGSHAYSEDTQTNWNGILGRFCLKAANPVRIRDVQVYPDIDAKTIGVRVCIQNFWNPVQDAILTLKAEAWNTQKTHSVPEKSCEVTLVSTDTILNLTYEIGEKMRLWSEFDPALYRLRAELRVQNQTVDRAERDFGMRSFETRGTQFSINGLTTFLRGKHDACVFPLTGHSPMDTEGWVRVFRIEREYGLNHVRFHSWCPPEAAFRAADICGMYLQPELPIWWAFDAHDSSQVAFMMKEGYRILDSYGSHASFAMFALGNEIYQDRAVLKQMIDDFRAHDARHLYAQGSNNRGGDPSLAEGDDFWVTFRTAPEKRDCSTDVRGSISFVDATRGGILNTFPPSTSRTYSQAIAASPIPVIGHEIGQYQVYPNYAAELPKYTGVLKPWNLELFQRRLREKGMGAQANDFFRASGALSVLCYREDIEMAMRTPGFGGFQLLDLQDYPGQGTALVGLLDAFMDSKGLITPEDFRRFCDETVLLLEMDCYCWTSDQNFSGEVQIVHYGQAPLSDKTVSWRITSEDDNLVYGSGKLEVPSIPQGGITPAGRIELKLADVPNAQKLMIHLRLEKSDIQNEYPIWVYPAESPINLPEDILIATRIDPTVIAALNRGGKVLLFPDSIAIADNSVGGQFISEFWNYGMFTSIAKQWHKQISPGTMGILTDPSHPIFQEFPTEFHSDWQWWQIVKNGRPVILDETNAEYRPIVQVIDNINRNYKLGLVFEFRIGDGRLLVCSAKLPEIQDRAEARALYRGILNFMESERFNPAVALTSEELGRIFR